MFLLGTHKSGWLGRPDFIGVPLFVSHWQLKDRAKMPTVTTTWALDSGGFTQLSRDPDGWPPRCEEPYVDAVDRYAAAGGLLWASQQDWMTEPPMLNGRTVAEHQDRTVANYLRLRELAPHLPFIPVVQGWTVDDYHRCVDLFDSAGVDLASLPTVGIGSVCRRQGTDEIVEVVTEVAGRGIKLHGFGVKTLGLPRLAPHLSSSDSMAWSFSARYDEPLPGCSHGVHGKGSCANCPVYALRWRRNLLRTMHERV